MPDINWSFYTTSKIGKLLKRKLFFAELCSTLIRKLIRLINKSNVVYFFVLVWYRENSEFFEVQFYFLNNMEKVGCMDG